MKQVDRCYCGYAGQLASVPLMLSGSLVSSPVIGRPGRNVATILADGFLPRSSLHGLAAAIDRCGRDRAIDTLLLTLYSPAGQTAGLGRVEQAVRRAREAGKRVGCFVGLAYGPALAVAAFCEFRVATVHSRMGLLVVADPNAYESPHVGLSASLRDLIRLAIPTADVPIVPAWQCHGEEAEARGLVDALVPPGREEVFEEAWLEREEPSR